MSAAPRESPAPKAAVEDGAVVPGTAPSYVIRGGDEGKRRLELLSRTLWPTTYRFLKSCGIRADMTVLDLACGAGDVTAGIARMAGRVVGIDMDEVKIDHARRRGVPNAEFRSGNVYEWDEHCVYDAIYARCLLTHLPDVAGALARIRRALKPGGSLMVEDIDFTGAFCHPACGAYDHYLDWYREVVRRRNGDADIGPKLYMHLSDAGFQGIEIGAIQPCHTTQEGKELSLSTLINIADAVIAESLADAAEMAEAIAQLEAFTKDPRTIVSLPRIFQAVGWRA